MIKYFFNQSLLTALMLLIMQPANAENITKKITFKPGEECWSYKGKAFQFEANLDASKDVIVKMLGYTEVAMNKYEWQGLDPYVVFPKGNPDMGTDGIFKFRTRNSGVHTFIVNPNSAQGSPVKVTICVK